MGRTLQSPETHLQARSRRRRKRRDPGTVGADLPCQVPGRLRIHRTLAFSPNLIFESVFFFLLSLSLNTRFIILHSSAARWALPGL